MLWWRIFLCSLSDSRKWACFKQGDIQTLLRRRLQGSTMRTFQPHRPVHLILLNSQRKALTMYQFLECLGCSKHCAVYFIVCSVLL